MQRTLLACVSAALLSVVGYVKASEGQGRVTPSISSMSPQQAVLDKYCVTCHNEKLRTAGLLLDKADVGHPSDNPAIWEKVLRKLRTREMPPPRMPRPDDAAYDSLSSYLESALDRVAEARPKPSRPSGYRPNPSP